MLLLLQTAVKVVIASVGFCCQPTTLVFLLRLLRLLVQTGNSLLPRLKLEY
jgi:hypothetical protein